MVAIPSLQFEHPVPESQVHKRAVSEVFPTDVVSIGADELWAGVRWPEHHSFYRHGPTRPDSYLLLETIRQLTILASHDHYGAPSSARFVMSGLGMFTLPNVEEVDLHPSEVAVRLRGTEVRRKPSGALQSVSMEVEFFAGTIPFATGHGDAMIVNERVYCRLRGGRIEEHQGGGRPRGSILSPQLVGHRDASDVVLGGAFSSTLITLSLDLDNRILFDHPLDHIAGMIPVEATRQILRVLRSDPNNELSGAEFHYAVALEFDGEITALVRASGDHAKVQFVQAGNVAVTGEVTVAPRVVAANRPGSDDRESPVRSPTVRPESRREERKSTFHELAAADLFAL